MLPVTMKMWMQFNVMPRTLEARETYSYSSLDIYKLMVEKTQKYNTRDSLTSELSPL